MTDDNIRLTPVRTVMSAPVVAIEAGCNLKVAVDAFVRTGLRHLVVVDSAGRSAGIVTFDQVTAAWLDPRTLRPVTVQEVAGTRSVWVAPDTCVHDAAVVMARHHLDAVPVVELSGLLVGVLTLSDLLRLLAS